jgi:hypothetical protein
VQVAYHQNLNQDKVLIAKSGDLVSGDSLVLVQVAYRQNLNQDKVLIAKSGDLVSGDL